MLSVCGVWWFIVLKEIQLFIISKNDDATWFVAVFTHSNKDDSFVDLTEFGCPCLEISLISGYHMRKEIFNSCVVFFFFNALE